jgi:hypothetical protein
MAQSSASLELAAMQAVTEALSKVEDAAARERVLRWVNDYFSSGAATSDAPAIEVTPEEVPAAQEPRAADPENLHSLFGNEEITLEPALLARRRSAPQPVVSELRSFVADFQKLASDWQAA